VNLALQFRNIGGWASGPIARNRTFFFVNYENEALRAGHDVPQSRRETPSGA
jgi:hypothetical protein